MGYLFLVVRVVGMVLRDGELVFSAEVDVAVS